MQVVISDAVLAQVQQAKNAHRVVPVAGRRVGCVCGVLFSSITETVEHVDRMIAQAAVSTWVEEVTRSVEAELITSLEESNNAAD